MTIDGYDSPDGPLSWVLRYEHFDETFFLDMSGAACKLSTSPNGRSVLSIALPLNATHSLFGIDRTFELEDIARKLHEQTPPAPSTFVLATDQELIATAKAYSGISSISDLVNEALKALVQREAAKQLANAGGSQPGVEAAPRR